jgi:aminoglycoside 6'-N-acetyltransferase I
MVRPMRESDAEQVLKMMQALLPDEEPSLERGSVFFVWEADEALGGFVELAVRPYVDGADIAPCPHLEAWYVAPELRRHGVGRALVAAAEAWALEHGYPEMTSDALIENELSLTAHEAIGFVPTERIQYFKKRLK